MADLDPRLLFEVLKRLQSDATQLGARMERLEGRLTRVEDRMDHLEGRVSAVSHLAQSVLVEISGINKRLENFTSKMLQMNRPVSALEARV